MKNKQYIYRWLFLPLVACIMAGTTGCGSDMTEESGKPSPDGGTYLTVTARGITTTPPASGGNYDDYIKTLRIIVFNEQGDVVCNELWGEGGKNLELGGTAPEQYIVLKEKIGNGGGKYSFYLIANEGEHKTTENGNPFLQTKLSSPTRESLAAIGIVSDTGDGQRPMLMTAVIPDITILPGEENNIGSIELVRNLAKIQLVVNNNAGVQSIAINNVRIKGQKPTSYSLLENSNYRATTFSDLPLADGTATSNGGQYDSGEIYFPERYCTGEPEGLKVEFTATANNNSKQYEVFIAEGKTGNTSEINSYNIYRNTHYTTTANIVKWGEPLQLGYQVAEWTDEEKWELEAGHPSINFNYYDGHNTTDVWYVSPKDEDKPHQITGAVSFQFDMLSDIQWNVSHDDNENFALKISKTDDNGQIFKLEETETKAKGNFIITVYPINPMSAGFPSCNLSMTYRNLTGTFENLLINGGGTIGGNDQYKVRINQIAPPSSN